VTKVKALFRYKRIQQHIKILLTETTKPIFLVNLIRREINFQVLNQESNVTFKYCSDVTYRNFSEVVMNKFSIQINNLNRAHLKSNVHQ